MSKLVSRPTLKSIAQETGVTANTVSLALRGSDLVNEKTREKILEAAKSQGYVHDMLAGSLRKGQSKTIALVFSDIGNQLYAIKIKKLEDIFRKKGYQILILNTNDCLEQECDAMRTVIGRKVDGVVCTPCQDGRASLDLLRRYGVPCVLVGRHFDDQMEDSVVWANEEGGYIATKYLLEKGCQTVLYLANRMDHISTERDRRSGYLRAMQEAGIEDRTAQAWCYSMRKTDGERTFDTISIPYDGVFAFSDMLAWEIASFVPPSVRVIGFDDVQSVLRFPFRLPSIGADLDLEAYWVSDLLLKRIENPERATEMKVLPVHLVDR